jgi:mannose-6-phosphate isomerase-like protein (cupin superfamily)
MGPISRSAGEGPAIYLPRSNEGRRSVEHPTAIRPEAFAVFDEKKMGKATLFRSDRLMVGLNAFEPGQEHGLHAHEGMDKLYHVLSGRGVFLLDDRELPMEAGQMLVAPAGVAHGIRNSGEERLVVLAVLAPSP